MNSHMPITARTVYRLLPLLVILILLPAGGTYAQYFGRNKVQYQTFDFKTLETPHFNILYYPATYQATVDAARMAERWYDRFTMLFQHELETDQPVIFYANHADFQQTNVIGGLISPGVGGVTEGLLNRVVLPLTGIYAENNHVLGHELIHAFQYSIMKSSESGLSAARGMPLWFVEGMAEYLTLGREYAATTMWLRDAVLHDDIPTIDDMTGKPGDYFPYRWGHAFWAWVAGVYGAEVVPSLFYSVVRGGWQYAFTDVLGTPPESLSVEFEEAIRQTFDEQLAGRTKPLELGEPALDEEEVEMVLSPSVSPDGRYAAFFAQRDIFSMNLYLADLETGEIVDELASSTSDAHFDALQFTTGAGAWSPSGDRFAFIVFKEGDNEVTIVDIESREINRTLDIPEVDAIYQLDWSPDGYSIIMSASQGGVGDLYRYHLDTDRLEQLTNDRFAQLHPSFSPDGRFIAYSTDMGATSDFDMMVFGAMQLAVMDLETRDFRILSISEQSKHIDPEFAPNGDLYFIGNPDGFNDIYRYSFEDDEFYRVTEVATGVSGLTENAPALSVAGDNGALLFTVFNESGYALRMLPPDEARGIRFEADLDERRAGALIPPQDRTTIVSEYLAPSTKRYYAEVTENGANGHGRNGNGTNGHEANGDGLRAYTVDGDSTIGLGRNGLGLSRDSMLFRNTDYDPSLSLTYVGQTAIGVGFDRFGTQVGGGASFLFTDLLGNRLLGVTAQASGRLKDIGGEVFYLNQRNRINWGIGGGHIPYLSAFFRFSDTTSGGQSLLVQELVREWTFFDRIDLMADYPISTNRRWEFTTGFSHVWYDREVEGILVRDGFIVGDYQRDIASPSSLNLGHVSAAYVGDYSMFGFTSPIRGSRYRFEVEPTFGSLTYLTALADMRQYVFFNPITLAFRGLHIGRYLDDADNIRLSDLYVGYQTLVRGYGAYSLEPRECTSGDCPVYSRLLGSRLAVINAEVRLPLLGVEEFGLLNFPYLPTELALFLDGGVAWTGDEPPVWKLTERSDERIPVFSAGVAARVNLFGYVIGQFYLAWPFQRPDQTTEFGFLIAPGW